MDVIPILSAPATGPAEADFNGLVFDNVFQVTGFSRELDGTGTLELCGEDGTTALIPCSAVQLEELCRQPALFRARFHLILSVTG